MTKTKAALEDTSADEVEEEEEEEEGREERSWLVPALVAGLVLSLALFATFFVLWIQSADPSPEDVGGYLSDAKPAVEERSTEIAKLLFTYDSTNIEQVADRVLALSTGNFAREYEQLIFRRGLGEALANAKASSRGVILEGPDVSFVGPAEAVVLFDIRQTVQNENNPGGIGVNYVTRLTLIDTTDGGWKADRIDLLSINED